MWAYIDYAGEQYTGEQYPRERKDAGALGCKHGERYTKSDGSAPAKSSHHDNNRTC